MYVRIEYKTLHFRCITECRISYMLLLLEVEQPRFLRIQKCFDRHSCVILYLVIERKIKIYDVIRKREIEKN